MKRYAAIDLGTNTFHMIIVEKSHENEIKVIHRSRHFVKLAYGGFDKIDDKALVKGLEVLKEFKSLMDRHDVDNYLAFGTSMFRRSLNGEKFAETILEKTGIKVQIIDGTCEARMIFKGALLANALSSEYNLLMDIGGGSVEFIITDKNKILYSKSYPIGIIELYHRFKEKEPFTDKAIEEILLFLKAQTEDLIKNLVDYNISTLIGTAGSFEVLHSALSDNINDHLFEVNPEDFNLLFKKVANTTYEERLSLEFIPPERKRLIVYAFLLIKHSLEITRPNVLRITSYSMKEGMIKTLLDEEECDI
ncbi:MAG TPA: hypothetical protein ENK91_12850 [Bacteroidetes bacterium]|nr:hypothetical protein [Bacteroidota bacterium]